MSRKSNCTLIKTGIYKLKWENNDYYYIGSSVDIDMRFKTHTNALKRGEHENSNIQSTYNIHGLPDIEIIDECNVLCLREREQSFLDLYKGDPNLLNILFDSRYMVNSTNNLNKRNLMLYVKVTEDELSKIKAKAKKIGLAVSTYLRLKALEE